MLLKGESVFSLKEKITTFQIAHKFLNKRWLTLWVFPWDLSKISFAVCYSCSDWGWYCGQTTWAYQSCSGGRRVRTSQGWTM